MFQALKNAGSKLATVAGLALVGIESASAAFTVPPEVAQAGTDAATLGLAVLGVLIGIKAFKWLRRAM